MNETLKAIIIGLERWQAKGEDATPMVKLLVLDLDNLTNETFHVSASVAANYMVDVADAEKVVAIDYELVRQQNTGLYKRRITKITYTGEKAHMTIVPQKSGK